MAARQPREERARWRCLELCRERLPSVAACIEAAVRAETTLGLPAAPEQFVASPAGQAAVLKQVVRTASGTLSDSIARAVAGCEYDAEHRGQVLAIVSSPHTELQRHLFRCQSSGPSSAIVLADSLLRLAQLHAGEYSRRDIMRLTKGKYETLLSELLCGGQPLERAQGLRTRAALALARTGELPTFLAELCYLVHRLCVARLHVVGDVFDAGAASDGVLETLVSHHAVDVQWGDHDVLWLGAASGSLVCICTIIKTALEEGTAAELETSYGISLLGLSELARVSYQGRGSLPLCHHGSLAGSHRELLDAMYMAVLVMLVKLEGQLILRRPYFKLNSFLAFGGEGRVRAGSIPTVSGDNPYSLSHSEASVLMGLRTGFMNSPRLQRHAKFLWENGSLYAIKSGVLLIHARIPFEEEETTTAISTGETSENSGDKHETRLKHLSFLPEEAVRYHEKVMFSMGRDVEKGTIREEYDALERCCRHAYNIGHETGALLTFEELEMIASFSFPPSSSSSSEEIDRKDFGENVVLERAGEFRNSVLRDRLLHRALAATMTNSNLTPDETQVLSDSHWRLLGQDLLWYLSRGPDSPLVSKEVKPTFLRLLMLTNNTNIEEREGKEENDKTPIATLTEEQVSSILREFGIPGGYIITGTPLEGNKVVSIGHDDGHLTSLLIDHRSMTLAHHYPDKTEPNGIRTQLEVVDRFPAERTRRDADDGLEEREEQMMALSLLEAYRSGFPTRDRDDW